VDVINEASSDSDLIVVGHRGLGGVFNLLLGSVAKQVVESCTIPVLVVKEKTS
jgi:nucleotide-binding universal stress UspA family protein